MHEDRGPSLGVSAGQGTVGPLGGGIFSLKGYKPRLVLKSYRLSTFHALGMLLASHKNNMKPQQGFRGALEVGIPPSWLQIPPCRRSFGTASHRDPPAGGGAGWGGTASQVAVAIRLPSRGHWRLWRGQRF